MVYKQYYPIDKLEWIIIDDGTDSVGDLVKSIPQVNIFTIKKNYLLVKKYYEFKMFRRYVIYIMMMIFIL